MLALVIAVTLGTADAGAADAGLVRVVNVERAQLIERGGRELSVLGGCWLDDGVCREVGRRVAEPRPTVWWFTISFALGIVTGAVVTWIFMK